MVQLMAAMGVGANVRLFHDIVGKKGGLYNATGSLRGLD